MALEGLFEVDFTNDNSQSMEDLFSEAQYNIEVARKKVDKVQQAEKYSHTPFSCPGWEQRDR